MTLDEIAMRCGTDKRSSDHGYTRVYEEILARFRDQPATLLEIGVAQGASLRMWKEWLPSAKVYGVDNNADSTKPGVFQADGVFLGDQSDAAFLASVVQKIGRPTIVIEDGGHRASQQIASFKALMPLVVPGGLYVVEDVHAWYSDGYVDCHPTAREFFTSLVDAVNVNGRGGVGNYEKAVAFTWGLPLPDFSAYVESLHFYQSLVVARRRA